MKMNTSCRGQSLRIAFGIAVLIILLLAGSASATLVTVSDRQILVDGAPFTIKGVGYSPVPIGIDPETASPYGDYFTSNYAAIYNRDLPFLRQMGANTIRLWGWNNAANHTDFLNKAYNNGTDPIYVIVTFWMGPSVYPDISSPSARAKIKADFRNMVATHKNNPAVLLWEIGNELNGPWLYGNNPTDLFSLINEMAQEAHLEEGTNYHPVTTPLADVNLINTIAAYDSNTTNLDVWSVQLYRGPSFGSFFNDYANVSGKPLVITEYGIDAYDDKNGDEYEKIGIPYQAKYAESLWNEIMANSNVSSGGSIMAYSDEWWKGKYGQARRGCPDNNPSFHSNCGYPTGSHPDGYSNEEWWGVMRTKDNGSYPDIMEPRVVYYTLQSLWTKTLGAPAITGFAPESPVSDTVGTTRTFNITVNQTVNIAWFINGTPVQTNNGVTSASYTNTSAALGTWNVTAVASNTNGTDSQIWVWNVTTPPVAGTPVITSWSNNKTNDASLNIMANVSETIRFNGTANQSITTWKWVVNDVDQNNNFDNFSYHFASAGTYKVEANATNTNGTSNTIMWNINVQAPVVAPIFNISGFKINGATGNGIQGWLISAENATTSVPIFNTTTDATGFYQIPNLTNGTYSVIEETRAEFTPNGSTFQNITIAGHDVTNVNFTNTPVTPVKLGSISGMKFEDINNNGVRDFFGIVPEKEPGLANWQINLNYTNGTVFRTTTTDSNGNYSFTNVPLGTYIVQEILQPNWKQTAPSTGIYTVTITSVGENVTGIDFGNNQILIPPPPTVSFSADKNTYNQGEPVTFTIVNNGTEIISLPTSAPWWVENANTGERVFTPVAADIITPLDPGQSKSWTWDQINDEGKQVPPGTYRGVINSSIGTSSTQEFEILSVPTPTNGSISGFSINTETGKGLPNVAIRLVGIVGMGVDTKQIRAETITDSMGKWMFDNLPAGRYIIIEQLPKGFIPVSPPVKNLMLAKGQNAMNNNFTNRPISSLIK